MSTNSYQIWLETDKQKLLLPVNPEVINIKISGNNQSVTVAELGEIPIPQDPKAVVLSFSSFFPATSFRGCQYAVQETTENVGDYNGDGKVDVRDLAAKARAEKNISNGMTIASENTMKVMPHFCIAFIENAQKSKQPIRVTITACDFIRYMVIESFDYKAGDLGVGDYSYSLSFKGYQPVNVRKIDVNTQTKKATVSTTPKRVDNTVKPKTHTVKSGDTIYALGKKYYGDVIQYRKIYDANKKQIGSNPNRIKPGMVLTLP